jgi:AcrR family transcriptional regulator
VGEQARTTANRILDAARSGLLADGYARLSTRRIAEIAGVPMSQIQYHFGSKQGLVLSLLEHEDRQLVERQRQMYSSDAPLWKRYEQACDLLEVDLASGYVRVLQEMIAAGWSEPELGAKVLGMLRSWFTVLQETAREAEARFGRLGPVSAADIAGLVGLAFLGGEAVILLGDEEWGRETRSWLRSIGELIRQLEEPDPDGRKM